MEGFNCRHIGAIYTRKISRGLHKPCLAEDPNLLYKWCILTSSCLTQASDNIHVGYSLCETRNLSLA